MLKHIFKGFKGTYIDIHTYMYNVVKNILLLENQLSINALQHAITYLHLGRYFLEICTYKTVLI
jgi:hypothetical protein